MTPESIIVIGQQALVVTAMLSAPLLLAALAAGLRDRHVPSRHADQRGDAELHSEAARARGRAVHRRRLDAEGDRRLHGTLIRSIPSLIG